MDDKLFDYLVATDALDEFLGKEQNNDDELEEIEEDNNRE